MHICCLMHTKPLVLPRHVPVRYDPAGQTRLLHFLQESSPSTPAGPAPPPPLERVTAVSGVRYSSVAHVGCFLQLNPSVVDLHSPTLHM